MLSCGDPEINQVKPVSSSSSFSQAEGCRWVVKTGMAGAAQSNAGLGGVGGGGYR